MMNWLKNTINKLTKNSGQTNYIVAEYHATKKKKVKSSDPLMSEFEIEKNATGEYMQIDKLHQKN
ncbi:MAG: hypothetical protein SFU55_07675 [Methylophilus sp.]|nr:hypothetical protein [Methylophilus sp.]